MGCAATKTQSKDPKKSLQLENIKLDKPEFNPETQILVTESILQDFVLHSLDPKITLRPYIKRGVMKSNGTVRIVKTYACQLMTGKEREYLYSSIHQLLSLNHIHISKAISYYYYDSIISLVSEYFDGGNLSLSADKITSKPLIELQEIFLQIVAGLQYIHHQGIVHGDLRLEHIIFEDKSYKKIKIIDFGISNKLKLITQQWRQRNTAQEFHFRAPEALKGQFSQKSDIWSCGALLFYLLSSHLPFEGKDVQSVKLAISRGVINFEGTEWSYVDQKLKNLIAKMMSPNPQERPTTEFILNEGYLKDITKANSKPNKAVLKNIQGFKAVNEIQAATLQYIADNLMSDIDKKKLFDEFSKYDLNNDGLLTKNELFEAYKKSIPEEQAKKEIENLFKRIDQNNSGKIDYREFLIASLDQKKYFNKEKLAQLFKQIDRDHSGHLSRHELLKLLREMQIPQTKVDAMAAKLDQNGDGQVSQEEFIYIMQDLQ